MNYFTVKSKTSVEHLDNHGHIRFTSDILSNGSHGNWRLAFWLPLSVCNVLAWLAVILVLVLRWVHWDINVRMWVTTKTPRCKRFRSRVGPCTPHYASPVSCGLASSSALLEPDELKHLLWVAKHIISFVTMIRPKQRGLRWSYTRSVWLALPLTDIHTNR